MTEEYMPAQSGKVTADEIEFRELFRILWEGRVPFLITVSTFFLLAALYVLIATDIYRAEVVLVPAEARQSASPLLSQLGGAAALIGINVAPQGGGAVDNAIAVINSREFIGKFITEHSVLAPLFAGTWDRATGAGFDDDIFDAATGQWQLENGAPTELVAFRKFRQILNVSRNAESGIITVSIEWHDPELAALWANQIVSDINRDFKSADVKEANDAIRYLREQLNQTQLVEMQRVFYQLIESQTRITMLADVREEYVLRVIDPAVVPDIKVAPRRGLILIISVIAGVMAGLIIIFLKNVIRSQSEK